MRSKARARRAVGSLARASHVLGQAYTTHARGLVVGPEGGKKCLEAVRQTGNAMQAYRAVRTAASQLPAPCC